MDTRGLEFARRAPHRLVVERNEDLAQIIAALGDLAGAALRRDRRRFVVKIIEQVAVARLVLDFLDRPKTLGDQQPDLGAAHLQQRIGGDGGAVGEEVDCRGIDAAADEIFDAVEHAGRRILGVVATFSTSSAPVPAS